MRARRSAWRPCREASRSRSKWLSRSRPLGSRIPPIGSSKEGLNMPVSRRRLLRLVGAADASPFSGAFLSARGLEAHLAEGQTQTPGQRAPRPVLPPGVEEIRISSNENPLGPGKAALDAILGKFPEAGRYPFNSTPGEGDLAAAIAAKHRIKPENIVVGAGSQEILKSAMRAFVTPA